jgi:type II secretory ATPase GspE/PulE/Tfp pilus assembly ATPase PilB-like protein
VASAPAVHASLAQQLGGLASAGHDYARQFVEVLLRAAVAAGASDIHLQPAAHGALWIRWRIDGVLQTVGTFSAGQSSDVVTRLKVLAQLLTYRSEVPQEGRIQPDVAASQNGRAAAADRAGVEMRLSTFPTLHGERAVVRLFAANARYEELDELGLPGDVLRQLERLLAETSGTILVTGPAGSGKTTTCYASLRKLVAATGGARSIVSIEDPVEVALTGVAQSQVNSAAGFDLAAGLKALLRQDPEVIMVSEIRDPATAALALGASLTGHLVIGSFHAASAAGAVSRLGDMGIEPYVLRSGVLGILCQRLVRRLCQCAVEIEKPEEKLGLAVAHARTAAGCAKCAGTGYRGRLVLAELLVPDDGEFGQAVLARNDAACLEQLAVAAGMTTRWQRAAQAVEAGQTSPAEIRRVLGFANG